MAQRFCSNLLLFVVVSCISLATNIGRAADNKVLTAEIPGGAELVLPYPAFMDAEVRRSDQRSLTVRVTSRSSREPMTLMLTFIQNPRGRAPSQQQTAEMVARMAGPHLANSVEGRIGLWEFDTLLAPAMMTTLTDRRYAGKSVPAGEYSSISVGQMATDEHAVAITLLTNGIDTPVFDDALSVIAALAVLPGDATTSGMPAPPAGYRWEACPEIKGALLRPKGWFFKKHIDGNDRAYFVTREDLEVEAGFTAGLTFLARVGYGKEKRVQASEFARNYIERAAESAHIRKQPWKTSMGPFIAHGVVTTTPDIRKGDYVTHKLVIANDETGTVYIVSFISPVEDWATMEAVSQPMLQRLFIDSDI